MRYELAEELLDRAEALVETTGSQESLLDLLDQAEKTSSEDLLVLCRCAKALFHYAMVHSKAHLFFIALDKLRLVKRKNPDFFETHAAWLHLWGSILMQIGRLLNDFSFYEEAIEHYKKALQKGDVGKNVEMLWNWDLAEAWALLGQKSGEIADVCQSIAKFYHLYNQGGSSFFFRLDYARALLLHSQLSGDPHILEVALFLLRGVIADSASNEESSVAYTVAWRNIAHTMKIRYELTHKQEHFEQADTAFREAILATTKNGEL